MKVFIYYRLGDNKTEKNIMYAYTSDKNIAKLFEKQRDMTKFKKKVKDLNTRELFNEFRYSENSSYFLVEEYLTSLDTEDELCISSDGGSGPYAMTKYESYTLRNSTDTILYSLFNHTNNFVDAMHPNIREALSSIYYEYIRNSYVDNMDNTHMNMSYCVYSWGMETDSVIINELGLFVRLFGNTIKGKKPT